MTGCPGAWNRSEPKGGPAEGPPSVPTRGSVRTPRHSPSHPPGGPAVVGGARGGGRRGAELATGGHCVSCCAQMVAMRIKKTKKTKADNEPTQ